MLRDRDRVDEQRLLIDRVEINVNYMLTICMNRRRKRVLPVLGMQFENASPTFSIVGELNWLALDIKELLKRLVK